MSYTSIFRERKLSLNHWRYRLLHWCFNEKNITCPAESALPEYLYCHYCPLFHLTNFIALFSWLILTIKVIVWSCKGIASAISKINWSFLKADLSKRFRRESEPREPTEAELKKIQWKYFFLKIKEDFNFNCSFEHFWGRHNIHFELLDKDEVEILFERITEKLRVARDRAIIRKERMQARIEYLIHLSHRLFKGLLYVVGAAFSASVAWLVYHSYGPVFAWFGDVFSAIGDAIAWLFSLKLPDIMPVLIIGGKILLAVGVLTTFILFVLRFKVAQKCGCCIQKTADCVVLTPFLFLIRMIGLPFMLLWKLSIVAKVFIAELYEDHCPPITIVDVNGEEMV